MQQNYAAARKIEKETGVPYQVLLAIPGNETGWGKAVAGENYFGIKGSNPKTGANTGSVGTWEVVNGQRVDIKDTFRAYSGYEESARDFASFLKDNPRYSKALQYLKQNPGDWRGFVREVHGAGYATDPEWSNKVIRIGNQFDNLPDEPDPSTPARDDWARTGMEPSPRQARLTTPLYARPDASGRQGVKSVIDVGMTAIGTKYQWGGAGGRSSFEDVMAPTDCSGFVSWAYQKATGHKLTAQTTGMWGQTREIKQDEAAPGDLVFYNMGKGANTEHVGIYMGNGQMLHDSSLNPNGGVDITPLWKGAQFRRVDGVDPTLASFGTSDELARIKARSRSARAKPPPLPPGDWIPFESEEAFVPEGMGAGQDIDAGGQTFDEWQLRLQREEMERAQREQAEAEAKANTPQPSNPFEAITQGIGGAFSGLGTKVQEVKQNIEQAIGPESEKPITEPLETLGEWADVKQPSETVQRQWRGEEDAQLGPVTIPGPVAAPFGAVGEQHIGPGVYVGRNLAGREQLQQTDPEYGALAQEVRDLDANTRQRWPTPEESERQTQIGVRMLEIERQNDLQNLAKSNPNLEAYQTGGELAQGAIAAVVLPGTIPRSVGGAVRAGVSLGVDPLSAPYLAGTEAVEAGVKAVRASRTAAETAEAALEARKAAVLAENAALNATPNGAAQADAVVRAVDPSTVATGGGGEMTDTIRKGGELMNGNLAGEMSDAARDAATAAKAAAETASPADEAVLLREAEERMARSKEELSRATREAAAPEQVAFDSPVAGALTRAYDPDEEISILQEAAIYLNDANLESEAQQLGKMVKDGSRVETMTGYQIRRRLEDAVAQSLAKYDILTEEHILHEVDRILDAAGQPNLTHRAATEAGIDTPEEMLQAAFRWYGEDTARQAAKISSERARDTRLFGGVPTPPSGVTRALAGGVPGGVTGAALAISAEDEEDNQDGLDYGNIATKGLLGFGIGAVGVGGAPYAAKAVYNGLDKGPLDLARWIFAPTHLVKDPEARGIVGEWANRYTMANHMGRALEDEWREVFGNKFDMRAAMILEETGSLPPDLAKLPGAQTAVDHWLAVADWARKYNIVPDPISGTGAAKVYLPHVLDEDWKAALEAAKKDVFKFGGGVEEGVTKPASYVSRNPFQYFQKQRTHETLRSGMFDPANPVVYSTDFAKILGNYYTRAMEIANNQVLIRNLDEHALKVTPGLTDKSALKGAEILRNVTGDAVIQGGKSLSNLPSFRYAGVDDVRVSDDLYRVFDNLMGDGERLSSLWGLRDVYKVSQFMRQNVLSGIDTYQWAQVSRALVTSMTGRHVEEAMGAAARGEWGKAGKEVWDAAADPIVKWTTSFAYGLSPNAYKAWTKLPETMPRMRRAMNDGLSLTSRDRPDEQSWKTKWFLSAANSLMTGGATYQGTLAMGGTEEEARENAIKAGAIGLGVGLPIFGNRPNKAGVGVSNYGVGLGKEQVSLAEAVSNAVWDRVIPYMKLHVYELYREKYGGPAAAEFTNQVLGGQNLMAIGRSRNVQDALRVAVMTPEWQEGFVRSVGNAAFNWGKDSELGHMNRVYWATALVGSAVALEGMNLALGGQWSWQNDPDKVLAVNTTRLYDTFGWDHKDPKTGETYTPYWDVLGPWRSLAEPMQETARWGLAGAYNATGLEADDLPGYQAVMGGFGAGVPAPPDPAQAWSKFVTARGGFVPALASEVISGKDFAGRPLNREEDPEYQSALNRVWAAFNNLTPSGQSDLTRGLASGEPPAAIAYQFITGQRVQQESGNTRFWDDFDKVLKEANVSGEEWRKARDTARNKNEQADKEIELRLQGLTDKQGNPVQPGQSDMTARERKDAMETWGAQRTSLREQQLDLLAGIPEGDKKEALRTEIQELQKHRVVAGGEVSSDLSDRPELDIDELIRQAWNRDPAEIERLKRTAPEPTTWQDMLGAKVREAIDRPPGYDDAARLQMIRNKWIVDTADDKDIDVAVLQDLIKAHVYQVTDSEGGYSPPVLKGVTSQKLDEYTQGWRDAGLNDKGKPVDDAATAARQRQEYVMRVAQEIGVDAQDLQTRIKLRNIPIADQTDAALGYSHAQDVLNEARYYKYLKPDGTPMGTPQEWAEYDKILDSKDARWDYQTSSGQKFYYKNGMVDQETTELDRARERATAGRYKDIFNSQHRDDYYRWYGDGANMTDAQWAQYTAGTLPMWKDTPDAREAQNRTTAMRLWKSQTPEERRVYGVSEAGQTPVTWRGRDEFGNQGTRRTSLAAYMQYINTYISDQYKAPDGTSILGDLDPRPPTPLSSGG